MNNTSNIRRRTPWISDSRMLRGKPFTAIHCSIKGTFIQQVSFDQMKSYLCPHQVQVNDLFSLDHLKEKKEREKTPLTEMVKAA